MKISICCITVLASLAATQPSLAQTYPSKAVRVIVPWPPGGSNDTVSRVVAEKLSETFGQPFVVELRPGAAGTLGADAVAKAAPDGYTLMVHSTAHLANAHLYKKLPYDTLRDFAGVALLAAQPGVLAVHPSLPVKTTREFIALAKSRPRAINYASAGSGSAGHLWMSLLVQITGIDITHVPYKGGVPQVTSVLSGETHAAVMAISTALGHIRAKRLRALGVTSLKRSITLPEVPTLAESGATGYEMNNWIGAFAPAGTPKPIIDRLNAEINKTLARPDIRRSLAGQAIEPWTATPDEFEAQIRRDFDKYGKLIRLTGAKVE